jgi:hypothetical protein
MAVGQACVLGFGLILMSGCSTTEQARLTLIEKPRKKNAVTARMTRRTRRSPQLPDRSIGNVLADPQPHVNRQIAISGLVRDAQIKPVSHDRTLLSLHVKDTDTNTPEISASPYPGQAAVTDPLGQGATLLRQASENVRDVPFQDLEADPIEQISYDLRTAASQTKALSLFYQAEGMPEIAAAIDQIAVGYRQVGEAYGTIAMVARYIADPTATDGGRDVGDNARVVVDVQPAERFQTYILMAAQELLKAVDFLIANRDGIDRSSFRFDHGKLTSQIGLALHSVGYVLEAEAWQYRKLHEPGLERDFREMSQVFVNLGEGIASINGGFRALGEQLDIQFPRIVFDSRGLTMLRCAYVGYNKAVLEDCRAKLAQLDGNEPITVHGRLIHGNLLEEMNLLWVKMESVTLDGLTINLAYDDGTNSIHNMAAFYDWTKTIEE